MNSFSFSIANLNVNLDAQGSNINFAVSESHKKFSNYRPPRGGLSLCIKNREPAKEENWKPVYVSSEIWELWQDPSQNFIFVQSEIAPPKRHIIVDKNFTNGEVTGQFSENNYKKIAPYPLQNIEIKMFINWLAGYCDLVLHALGLRLDGRGYCFAGPSGIGKSTLAEMLNNIPGIELLAEDNVVLRYVDGQFWIYGTPWHLDAKMCSSGSAPLDGILFLDRSIAPGVIDCKPLQGVTRILQTAFMPYYRKETLSGILDRLNLLSKTTPFYLAHYQLGSDPLAFFQFLS